MANLLKTFLKCALLAACVYYLVNDLDLPILWSSLRRLPPGPLFAATVFCFLVLVVPPALRLVHISEGESSLGISLLATVLCLGLNNILPAKLGDAAKAYALHQEACLPLAKGLEIVFWERFFDINAMLLCGVTAFALLHLGAGMAPLALAVAGMWIVLLILRRFPELGPRLARAIPLRSLRSLVEEILGYLRHRLTAQAMFRIGLWSLLVWALYILVLWIVLVWLAGLPLSLGQTVVVFAVSAVGMALPSSPGAVGVYEASFVLSLGWFGIDKGSALAAALVFHAMQFIPPILGLLLLVVSGRLDLSRVLESVRRKTRPVRDAAY